MILRSLAIFCLLLMDVQAAHAAKCLKYDPTIVRLTGVVSPIQFYGPPNYGEDPARDSKEIAAVLKLDKPVRMCGTPDGEAGSSASRKVIGMQMVFHSAPYGSQWNGKHVTVTGKLFTAETGHHHTPVLIDVIEIYLAGSAVP